MIETRCLEAHQLPWQHRSRYLTHNMRCRTLQTFGKKKGVPSHSNTDVTRFQCRCIVDSISSLPSNQVNKVIKGGRKKRNLRQRRHYRPSSSFPPR